MATMSASIGREAQAISLIGFAHFLSHFYQLALPPLFNLMHADLGVSYVALGTAFAVYNIATAALQTPVGFLVDRIGARWVLIVGLLVNAAAIVAVGLIDSYWMLLAAMVAAGAGNSVFHPADYAILAASVDERRLGRAFSLHTLGGTLGFAAAPVVLIFLASIWDWRMALILSGLVGVALAVVMPLFSGAISHDHTRKRKHGEAPWAVLMNRGILLFFGFYILSAAAGVGVGSFSVVALIAIYGVSQEVAGSVLTAFYLMISAGVLLGGYVADRTNRHDTVLAITFGIAALCLLAIATGALAFWLVVGLFCIAGAFRGFVNPSRDILLKRMTPAGSMGAVFGFVTTGFAVGQGTAPILYGWVMDKGAPSAIFWIAGALTVLTIGIVFVARSGRSVHA